MSREEIAEGCSDVMGMVINARSVEFGTTVVTVGLLRGTGTRSVSSIVQRLV